MVTLVVNNDNLSQITQLGFSRIGLNKDENDDILKSYPQEQFIRATENYNLCWDKTEEIEETLRPSLKKYMEGPFVLAIYNHGESLDKSLMIFEILAQNEPEETSDLIKDPSSLTLTSMSLGVLPFVDLFRKEIDKEVEYALQFKKEYEVTKLSDIRAQQEKDLAESMMDSFFKNINSKKDEEKTLPLGKEAMSDTLASGISAQNEFYSYLWDNMTEFYESSFRRLGQQYALGKVSLESPQIIAPN